MAGLGTPYISDTYSAIGTVTTPTAGQTIVSLPASSLGNGAPTSYWSIRIIGGAYSTGPVAAAPLVNNLNLMRGGSVYAQLFNIPQFGQEEAIWYIILGPTDSVSIQAIANETTGIAYNIGLRATRVA
jgi:hypothetical protein